MKNTEIALIVDSCTDVPENLIESYGMYVVPLTVNYHDGSYLDKVTITPQEVYDRFSEEIPTTSTPSSASAKAVFEQVIADGYTQAVVVTISSGLSATYELLCSTAQEFPELSSVVVDTKNIGMGAGLSAIRAAQLIEQGVAFSEMEARMARVVKNTKVFFCVDTLEYLHKGGRIGLVTFAVGSLLDMRPVISCNEEGVYYTVSKARGRKQSLKKALSVAEKFASEFPECAIAVVNGDAALEAEGVLAEMKDHVANHTAVYDGQISPVLVVHTGPGLIGIGVQGLD
ncbi:DegV family protein [Raoultibacter phocaeensis]|uniref:DegV family protein n=1 Tax=Raoultibacter phocaeensis TaxID=2479841 RepID=UPI00111B46DC|nr:DegV family protein [Raoultibacter phocaeensis]